MELEQFDFASSIEKDVVDPSAAKGCWAGLWLLHQYLDESHCLSQSLKSPEGSWWHAIMHRMEGDYGNSKYWYRSIGQHVALDSFHQHLQQSNKLNISDSFEFVDNCRTDSAAPEVNRLARLEWQILFDHCFRLATGQ